MRCLIRWLRGPGAASMSLRIVVTGTDTGIGKTVFAAGVANLIGANYWKPIQAGIEEETYSQLVAKLGGLSPDRIVPEVCRLRTPASPHYAAQLDGIRIDIDSLNVPDPGDRPLVIEGAGADMVPLDDTTLFERWRLPVVLCTSTEWGTINHSLLSIEALRRRQIPSLGWHSSAIKKPKPKMQFARWEGCAVWGDCHWLSPLTSRTLSAAFRSAFHPERFQTMTQRKTSPIWHPFTQHALEGKMSKVVRGDGAYLHKDGRRIIDAISSWWVALDYGAGPDDP